ncbi:Acyl_transf_3 domain-containing protein [Caenorhabditis elegans]|uniref:Acyl_transf_3 domain-containing protein n=1 Tax=Caenorhabditis elegans TaxID=6239 RepID=Q86MF6_CAEEL|nr:Acyl_transf_3 domain-containing protein [Caenorhabditis elegans]CCD70192.1 Acyl_transf_3 domain-containing protein [Caenorhabditis elegans]|eukprot:NP_500432.3 O-ACyltransferase homolog [Caenorhabditis elegans]
MDQQKQKPSKRLDLQGIRALAILVVLGFHFYPEFLPNGYLGVDQFFVLSGFLMCMLLKRAENQSACSLVTLFYSKRFKRILPLYLLIILISMICLYNFFPDTAIETNKESALHALLFVSNRPKTVAEDYFTMLSIAIDIFTHTWSLSVEIQFYFLVPFIFLLSTKLPGKQQYGYYGVIGLSLVYFYSVPGTVAFNSVFARIWQFMIGMVVYLLGTTKPTYPHYQVLSNLDDEEEDCKQLLSDEESQECCSKEKFSEILKFSQPVSYFALVILLAINVFPFTLPAGLVRPLVTMGTGFLMLLSEDNLVLSNRILTYIGDISFSLYLIHWPIYAYWKLTCNGSHVLLALALASSIVLAVITYETFEKWYLRLTSTSIGILVVALFFINVVVINKDDISDQVNSFGKDISSLDNVTDDMTLDDVERLNYRWSVNDNKNLFTSTCDYENKKSALGWCRHTGLPKSGKYRLATIGNSWTANHAKMFYQECSYKAKSIMQGSAFGCEPLYPSAQSKMCKANFTDFEQRIRKEKPDFAFIFTRYMSIGAPFPKNVSSFDQDPIYQTMKEQMLKFISNIKYKLYILDALPRINRGVINQLAKLFRNHTDPVAIDDMFVRPAEYEMARKRHAQLVKDCKGKCIMVDYVPEFYNTETGTFRYFDERGFSYWTTPSHLSPHGIEHVRHVWRDICEKL